MPTSEPLQADTNALPKGPAWHWALLIGIAIGCYANTFNHGFTYDDIPAIAENQRVRSLNLSDLWLTDYWGQSQTESAHLSPNRDRLYRPLTLTSFALNHAFTGMNASPMHITNVAMHALATLLVYWVAKALFADAIAALFAAMLFAVHPVHVEAVANLVGRAEILATICLGMAILRMLQASAITTAVLLHCGIWGTLGLFAKETALCYPLLVLLIARWGRPNEQPVALPIWLQRTVIVCLPLLVYFPLRLYALDGHLTRSGAIDPFLNPLAGPEVGAGFRIIGCFTILGHYARLMFVPTHLQSDYGLATIDPTQAWQTTTLVGLVAFAVLVFGIAQCKRSLWGVLAGLFLASYLLISNSLLLIGVSVAERLAYWPSVIVCLAVGAAIRLNVPDRRIATGVLLVLCLAMSVRTVTRNPVWASNATLFASDAAANPENVQLQMGWAHTLLRDAERGAPAAKQAGEVLDRAMQHTARSARLLALRGKAAILSNEIETGAAFLNQAVQLDPTMQWAQRLLAETNAPEARRSITQLEAAVTQQPQDAGALLALGIAYTEVGRAPEAIPLLESAVAQRPDDAAARRALGDAYVRSGQNDAALPHYQRVTELHNADWQAHLNISAIVAHRDRDRAWKHAQRASELAGGDWRVQYNLAEAHMLFDRRAEARQILLALVEQFDTADPRRQTIEQRLQQLK